MLPNYTCSERISIAYAYYEYLLVPPPFCLRRRRRRLIFLSDWVEWVNIAYYIFFALSLSLHRQPPNFLPLLLIPFLESTDNSILLNTNSSNSSSGGAYQSGEFPAAAAAQFDQGKGKKEGRIRIFYGLLYSRTYLRVHIVSFREERKKRKRRRTDWLTADVFFTCVEWAPWFPLLLLLLILLHPCR